MQAEQGVSFGSYHLAGPQGPLVLKSRTVNLPPKALAILWLLVARAGQVVTKEELLATVWADTVVGEETLTTFIGILRRALQDNARQPRYIATVHRVGFRFLEKVVSSQQSAVSREEGTRDWGLGTGPSPQAPSPQPLVPSLVGRDVELARLHSLFVKSLNGERQIVFVAGEAGIGKTSLIDTFLRSLESRDLSPEENQKSRVKRQKAKIETAPSPRAPSPKPLAPRLWLGWGQCIEHYGAGEAYLPVLEALGRLGRQPSGERLVTTLSQYALTWLV
jgi:DNA-binding winged helix-turn-helix (wHTH) protein